MGPSAPSPPPSPFTPPSPPSPPAFYSFWRCYLQTDGKKYVRMYSDKSEHLTAGIEGDCTVVNSMYYCGKSGCNTCTDEYDTIEGAPGYTAGFLEKRLELLA